jgi:hypothetical protein
LGDITQVMRGQDQERDRAARRQLSTPDDSLRGDIVDHPPTQTEVPPPPSWFKAGPRLAKDLPETNRHKRLDDGRLVLTVPNAVQCPLHWNWATLLRQAHGKRTNDIHCGAF